MKTMTARYRGRCERCDFPIEPGDSINYRRKGRSSHVECPADGVPFDRGYGPPVRVHVTRFSSGHTSIRNVRGRCEDSPCCGCCID